jgi:hypothetical protein
MCFFQCFVLKVVCPFVHAIQVVVSIEQFLDSGSCSSCSFFAVLIQAYASTMCGCMYIYIFISLDPPSIYENFFKKYLKNRVTCSFLGVLGGSRYHVHFVVCVFLYQ